MGQTRQSMQQITALHSAAYNPIHRYIQDIIRFLEERQELVKRILDSKNASTTQKNSFKQQLNIINNRIKYLLDITELENIEL